MEKSAIDNKTIAAWYQQLDPDRKLDENDWATQIVDLDGWAKSNKEPAHLRGQSAKQLLIRGILLADAAHAGSTAQLFAGHRGSGKTTELRKIGKSLEDNGFVVLQFSASDFHPMNAVLSPTELAIVLEAGIRETAEELWGISLNKSGSIFDRLKKLLMEQSVSLEINFDGLPVKLKLNGPQVQNLGKHIQGAVERANVDIHLRLKEFVHTTVKEVVTRRESNRVVILVDDLEKYKVPSDKAHDVYRSVADLFANWDDLLKLPNCHVVYVVPPYLNYLNQAIAASYGGRMFILSSVRVHSRPPERNPDPDGIAALRQVLTKRIPIEIAFGSEYKSIVQKIVEITGGHVRDLLLFVRYVLLLHYDQTTAIRQATVDQAIRDFSSDKNQIFKEMWDFLNRVGSSPDQPISDDELRPFTRSMDQYLLLFYHNGLPWIDVHPMLLERPKHSD